MIKVRCMKNLTIEHLMTGIVRILVGFFQFYIYDPIDMKLS